jgi:hypothetical protein
MTKIKGKKAKDAELTLSTIIGIVLAMMALIAIFSLIASLFNLFTDREKERGVENGFFELTSVVESLKAGDNASPTPVMLDENYAIVGFNPNQNQAVGKCGDPSINHKTFAASKLSFAITRDSIKCPLDSSCLCLCKAQKIDSMFRGVFDDKYEYVNCFSGTICRAYILEKGKNYIPTFKKTENCDFAMIFDTKITNIELLKDTSGEVLLRKKQ